MIDARLKIALGTCLVVGAAAIAITLSGSPVAVAHVNTSEETFIGQTERPLSACQSDEQLPRETTAIRLRLFAFLGPRVTVSVLEHGRVIAHGERASGWTGGVATLPVTPLSSARAPVEVCFRLYLNGEETAQLVGEQTTGALAASSRYGPLPGRVRIEYLRPSGSSWWSLAPSVIRRMGLGRAWSGTWSVFVVIALMAGAALLSSVVILRGLR